MAAALQDLVDDLCGASARRRAEPLPWPEALEPEAAVWMSPELCSLFGTPAWDRLDEAARRRLGFFELTLLCSLNIHGEARLLDGLERRRARTADDRARAYLDHFAAEERDHTAMFVELCRRAGRTYPERRIAFPGIAVLENAPGEVDDVLFFGRVLIFEEIIDHYNVALARDARLHPLARAINRLHHRDEARHLAFGRAMLRDLWASRAPAWSPETRASLIGQLRAFGQASFSDFFEPAAYRDAGLDDVYGLRRAAMAAPAAAQRFEGVASRAAAFFRELGFELLPAGSHAR